MTPSLPMRLLRWYGRAMPVQKGKARLAHAIFRRLSIAKEPLLAKTFAGIETELWPWLWADFAMYCIGGTELFLLDYFRSLLRHDAVVFDVGAYIGMYTFAAAPLTSQGKVVAFEPDPRSAHRLAEALEASGWHHVQLCKCAAGRSAGKRQLALGAYPPQSAVRGSATPTPSDLTDVTQLTLDDYCAKAGITKVDVIKIDTEGAELDVLQGASGTLSSHRPVLIVELHEEQAASFGHTIDETLTFLIAHGYEPFQVAAGWFRPKLRPFSPSSKTSRPIIVAHPKV